MTLGGIGIVEEFHIFSLNISYQTPNDNNDEAHTCNVELPAYLNPPFLVLCAKGLQDSPKAYQ